MYIFFFSESDHGYHFIIKELGEEFKKQFICLGENAEKYTTFTIPKEKEVTRTNKNGEEVTKIYLTCYKLLAAQDLWQVHYRILSITFLMEFIQLIANLETMTKNVDHVQLNISIATVFLNTKVLKMI